MPKEKIALVTGCSTGIGYITSLTLARNGFYTYATMCNLDKSSNIKEISSKESLPLEVLQLDVTNDESAKNAMEVLKAKKNRIDVLVNNAGYGLIGSIEEISIKKLKAQFETNLFGMVRVTQQVLPIMRMQKEGGRIINVSSRLAEAMTEDIAKILNIKKEEVIIVFQEAPHGNWYSSGVRL